MGTICASTGWRADAMALAARRGATEGFGLALGDLMAEARDRGAMAHPAGSLVLAARDVIDMAGMNSFNAGASWNGLADTVARHQLLVVRDAGDRLAFVDSGSWDHAGLAVDDGKTYEVFNNGSALAQVLVLLLQALELLAQVLEEVPKAYLE